MRDQVETCAPSADEELSLDEAGRLGRKAIDAAVHHRTPPLPDAYEVWFSYVREDNPELNDYLDELYDQEGGLTPELIAQIRDRFFASEPLSAGISVISAEMERTLESMISRLSRGAADGEEFGDELNKISIALAEAGSAADADRILRHMLELSADQARKAHELGEALNEARTEVTALRQNLVDLRQDAMVDHLTKLYNRRYFDAKLAEHLALSRKTRAPLSFAILDIDHFKLLNDTWGHAAGDEVLRKLAEVIRENLLELDIPARLGGEEFVVIMPNTSIRRAVSLAEKLRKKFETLRVHDRSSGATIENVTASIGVTALREDDSAESLVGRADELLYKAKNGGRNTVKYSA